MANEENIAAGVFELRAEAGQFSAVVGNATEIAQRFERVVLESFNKAGKAASDTSAVESSAKRYVSALEREALALERKTVALVSTLAEQRRAEAAGRGQSAEAEAVIAKIDRAEKSYKSLSDTLRQVANINAFGELLTKSEALGQVGKNIDGITAALERLEGEERQLGQTRVFEARVAEAAKLGMAEQYIERYKQAGQNMAAAEKAFAADTSFIDSLQRRANAINKTQSELLELEAAQRGLTAQAAPHIAALRAQEKALGIYSAGARDARVQTNQMRTALSQLPMQFTDIFTSLAGGQNPLLVLIQQGGQIKDSFGGIGPALRGMAGAIASAFTPVRVLIGGALAVVGAFTAGVVAGEKEMTAYRVALSLTGNAAGATAGQLQSAAEAVSRVVGTQGKAAEAIAALAATGRVAAADLDKLAEAAIRLEREGGPAVKDTVAAFAELGKAPTAGALKLNESTRFLTVSVLEQIKALEEQGRATEAARLAQRAYADESIARTKQLEQQLGSLEKAARGVTTFFKEMWDAVLDVGRQETPAKRIEGITKALEANARRTDRSDSFGPSGVREGGDAQRSRLLDELKAANRAILNDFERTGKAAANIVDDAYVKAAASVKKWGDESQTSTQKAEKALKEFRREVETVNAKRVADGLQPLSKAEIQRSEQALIESFNKGNKAIKERDSVLEAARAEAKRWADEIAGFQKIGADATATVENLTKAEQLLIEALKNPAWATRSAEQKQETISAYLASKAKEDLAASTKAAEKALQDYTKAVIANAAAMASDEAKVEADLQRLRDEYVELTAGKEALEAQAIARLELAAAMKEQAAAQALIDGASDSALVADSLQRQAQALRDQIAQRGLNQGARRNNELAEENRKASEDAAQEWTRTVDGIRDGLTDAFRRAFESGENFGTAFAKVIEREIKSRIATSLAGALANWVIGVTGLTGGSANQGGGSNAFGTASSLSSVYTAVERMYGMGKQAYGWYSGTAAAPWAATAGPGLTAQTGTYGTMLGSSTGFGAGSGMGGTGAGLSYNAGNTWSGLAANEAAATTSTTTASTSGASSMGAYALYAAIAIKSYQQAQKDWAEGFRKEQSSEVMRDQPWLRPIFGAQNIVDTVLQKLGVSEKWAHMLSGSSHAARIFGRSSPQIEAQGVSGTFGAGSFEGQAFTDIRQRGGWFRSDKRSTELTTLPDEIKRMLSTAAKTVFDETVKFGEALGLPAEQLGQVTKDIKVALVQAENDTPEAIQKASQANFTALSESLTGYGDALVASYADAVKPLANYGETTAETIKRVGSAIAGVNEVLDTLGVTALAASIDGGKAALALEGLFGGIVGLQQAAGGYLQAYYTNAERAALTTAALGKEFAKVGLTLPETREGFRELVEAQDLTTESGRAAFTALMSAAGAFDQVQQSAEAMAQELSSAIEQALPKFQRDDPYGTIQSKLAGVGVSLSIEQLMGASKDDIYAFAESFLSLSTSTHEAKMAVVAAASALADLRDTAEETATDITRAAEDMARNIWQGLSAAIADFVPARELATFRAGEVQNTLLGGGITTSVEAILGSTREDIVALWNAVGNEGKAAILEAYGAWQSMREAILEADIADIVGPLGTTADELLEAYAELTPATDNLVTSWRNTKAEVELLGDALAEIDGTAAVSAIDALRGLISQRDGLAGVISNNEDQIFNLRVGQGGQSAIDLLRQREASLWTQFASTNNPEIARAITETTLQRIALESELQGDANAAQIDALKEQISAAERLRDLAAQMGTFILGLQAGSLSNLGYAGRLAASEQLFSNSLTTGMDVQGNAQSYLQSAQGIYGGATGAYSDIFESVTGRLRGIMGVDYEGQISEAQAQLQELEGINASANAQIAALTELNGKFGVGLDSLNMQVATQTQAVRDQIVELKTLQTNQERQILQFGEALDKLITAGGRTADAVEELVDAGGMAGAEP